MLYFYIELETGWKQFTVTEIWEPLYFSSGLGGLDDCLFKDKTVAVML